MISFVSASKISFDFMSSIDSYSDICYLGTDELIIFVSFPWMIWIDLPFLIYLCFLSMNDLSWSSFFDLSIYLSIFFTSLIFHSFQNCSLISSPNSGFSFYYVSSIWHFFLKRHFHRHACISTQKQERKSQAGGVYTAGDDLLARTPSTH